jgi:hypothetical protein
VTITAKDAVANAKRYMVEIYGDSIQGLNVEEVEYNEESNLWHVTMGYWEFLPVPPTHNALADLTAPRKVRRAYKGLSIHNVDGQVLSMKIRVVPSADR